MWTFHSWGQCFSGTKVFCIEFLRPKIHQPQIFLTNVCSRNTLDPNLICSNIYEPNFISPSLFGTTNGSLPFNVWTIRKFWVTDSFILKSFWTKDIFEPRIFYQRFLKSHKLGKVDSISIENMHLESSTHKEYLYAEPECGSVRHFILS